MNRIAIYPGSFDPVTHGHLDIVRRAAGIFDRVIVAVTDHGEKKTLFSLNERVDLFGKAVRGWPKVSVERFNGLLVDYASAKKACAIVRGLRAVSDFEYEFQMALMNRRLSKRRNSSLETVYMMPGEKYTYLSSSLVKEVARLKGNIDHFVPPAAGAALKKRILSQNFVPGLTKNPFSVTRMINGK